MVFATADVGFKQEVPQAQNAFLEDPVLISVLERLLPDNVLKEIVPYVDSFWRVTSTHIDSKLLHLISSRCPSLFLTCGVHAEHFFSSHFSAHNSYDSDLTQIAEWSITGNVKT